MRELYLQEKPVIAGRIFELRQRGFFLHGVRDSNELEQVYRLTYECYVREGYCRKNEAGRLVHYPHLDQSPETTVFVVDDADGRMIGTCSTTIDNPYGLHVDEDFREQANLVRQEGRRLASSWRIAVDKQHRSGARVARLLIEGSIAYWHAASIQTCLMTFNPCHERFYASYMNCITLDRKDGLHDLSNAPAVLMRWDAERCPFRAAFTSVESQVRH